MTTINFIDSTEQTRLMTIVSDKFTEIKTFFVANSIDQSNLQPLIDNVYTYFNLMVQSMNGIKNDNQNTIDFISHS